MASARDEHDRLILRRPTAGALPHQPSLDITDAITVEARVETTDTRAEVMQSLVSRWAPLTEPGPRAAYDASNIGGMDTTGFFGAVFDGRFIYFVPQHDKTTRHGKVLRYDTHSEFKSPLGWQAYDASRTGGLRCMGYYGAAFDGRYIFFAPRRDPEGFHSRVLRYDTRGGFTDPGSWTVHHVGVDSSSQSLAFDGRYLYFNPGQYAQLRTAGAGAAAAADDNSPRVTGMSTDQVLLASGRVIRHDTRSGFTVPTSWTMHDVAGTDGLDTRDFDGSCFDGRFIYFAPLAYAAPLRYDTQEDFHNPASWQSYDCAKRFGMKRNVGAIFDGRYVYFVPYGSCPVAVRFDTTRDFVDDDAWRAYELKRTPGITLGFDGACFDGRFIWYIPYWDEGTVAHGVILRYDTLGDFESPTAWSCHDATQTDGLFTGGFNGGASDGRYFYFSPWLRGGPFTGKIGGGGNVLRVDTTGPRAAFDLRFCDLGHNGGLCAAVPGPRFLVNTELGPRSVAANAVPPAGKHHFAGVYDGKTISLYIDGKLTNSQPASGKLVTSDVGLAIGQVLNGAGVFRGTVHEVRISAVARSAAWLAVQQAN